MLKKTGAVVLTLVSLCLFQNCSPQGFSSHSIEALSTNDKVVSSNLAGNGEGYGGKLSGVYSNVDSTNQCGQQTTDQYPVRQQIEVKEGVAYKTVDNCQKLATARPVQQSQAQTTSADGRVLVFDNQVYEHAAWSSTGWAPKDGFVQTFCQGRDASQTLSQTLEAFIYAYVSYVYSGSTVTQVNAGYQSISTVNGVTTVQNGSQQTITSGNGTTTIQNGSQNIVVTNGTTTIQNGSQTLTTSSMSYVPPDVLSAMTGPVCWSSN